MYYVEQISKCLINQLLKNSRTALRAGMEDLPMVPRSRN